MSRKYGQRGYMEGEREERPARGSAPREREDRLRPSRPKGRGLGAPEREVFRCAACGAEGAGPPPDGFAARCDACGKPLHACRNCAAFDTGVPRECRHPEVTVRVASKTAANECGHFHPKVALEAATEKAAPGDARSAFDDLFEGI